MTVLPTFWNVMRKTTLLPTATGWLVGLNKIFVTFSAARLTCNVTEDVLVAVPPLAVAEFVAAPVASVVKVTLMFVLWPGAKPPRLFHVKTPEPVELGAGLALA